MLYLSPSQWQNRVYLKLYWIEAQDCDLWHFLQSNRPWTNGAALGDAVHYYNTTRQAHINFLSVHLSVALLFYLLTCSTDKKKRKKKESLSPLKQFHRTRWAPPPLTSRQNRGVVMWRARSKNKGEVCLAVWQGERIGRGAGSHFLSPSLIL